MEMPVYLVRGGVCLLKSGNVNTLEMLNSPTVSIYTLAALTPSPVQLPNAKVNQSLHSFIPVTVQFSNARMS